MRKNTSSFNRCSYCDTEKYSAEFFRYNSTLSDTKHILVCKKCLKEIYRDLLNLYGDIYFALIHLCLNLNVEFDFDLALKTIKDRSPVDSVIVYLEEITKRTGLRKATSCTENTIDNIKDYINSNSNKNATSKEDVINNFEVTNEIYARWGFEYSKQDLFFLQSIYDSLVDDYGEGSVVESRLFTDYAIGELMKKRAKESGNTDEYMKLRTSQSKLIGDASLKPKRENMENNDSYLIGMVAKQIEETRPISEIDERYNDVDKIQESLNEYIKQLKRSTGAFR